MAGAKGRRWKCRGRPCSACRRWFRPDPRARDRQTVCGLPECRRERHRRACARWRMDNPDYDREDRLRRRVRPPDRADAPPSARLDWGAVRAAVGLEVAVVVEEVGQVLLAAARDDFVGQPAVPKGESGQVLPVPARDDIATSTGRPQRRIRSSPPRPGARRHRHLDRAAVGSAHPLKEAGAGPASPVRPRFQGGFRGVCPVVEVELHELELRYADLRLGDPGRHARLLASMARHGQRSPVLVTPDAGDRFVLIDGYARVEVLRELGRDLVLAVVLDLGDAEALVLAWRLEAQRRRSPLEEGWLVRALLQLQDADQRQVAERLQRSVSWVSRRLGLVDDLPLAAQQAVRAGTVPAHGAEKYLLPLARAKRTDCERLVAGLGGEPVTDREIERLYRAWKSADSEGRERIVAQPRLALKAAAAMQPEPAVPPGDPAGPLLADLDGIAGLARRARRRLDEGLLDDLDARRRGLVARQGTVARLLVHAVSERLDQEEVPCSTATPASPS